MYKLTIKFNNGSEFTYKTPFTCDKIENIVISDCPYTLFLRHADNNPKAKALLDNNKYLDLNKDSVLTYFGATITSFENTIIIMTSNAGSNLNNNSIGFGKQTIDASKVEEALKNF